MPQAGFKPPVHSDTSYEADALHSSHHGWFFRLEVDKFNLYKFAFLEVSVKNRFKTREYLQKITTILYNKIFSRIMMPFTGPMTLSKS